MKTTPTTFSEFEDLPAVVERIDSLVFEARTLRGKEKKAKVHEAQRLADAYDKHCQAGGNTVTSFNLI